MQDTKDRPTVEETYTEAVSASNLRFETREGSPIGAAGLLVAAGWSESRVGAIFMRLHSEWDGVSMPSRLNPERVKQLAATVKENHVVVNGKQVPRDTWAKEEAQRWYEHEVMLVLQRLKSLPEARSVIDAQAEKWKIHGSSSSIIKYWLDQNCQTCNGLRRQKTAGTPMLSNRVCPACRGTGLSHVPMGSEGRQLLNYIDDCVARARASIKSRLGHMRKPVEK